MKPSLLFIAFLACLVLIGYVCAADLPYTNVFNDTSDQVHVNQSYTQDPTRGQAEPWELWILSGVIGLFLIIFALVKPRLYKMDYEINVILSVIAWPFLWYWTWGGLGSLDYIVGTGITSTFDTGDHIMETVMITQHIYYSFPILGWIGIAACVASVFITILLIGQFNLFKENEENQNQRSENV